MSVDIGTVPFQEAIDFFKSKLNLTTRYWDELVGSVHTKAFTVAGAVKEDLLEDLRSSVDQALSNGTTITEFRKSFDELIAKHGWDYKGNRAWRTRVIYDTNLRSSHMAGRWQQFQRVKERRPYLQYNTAGDKRVRPEHRAWDGLVLPIDDEFWDTHYPLNGWGCRCGVRSLSLTQIRRSKLDIGQTPAIKRTERINTKTGEVYGMVPEGIDVGWDYNVGKEYLKME